MESFSKLIEQKKLAGENGEIAVSLGKLTVQKKRTNEKEDISAFRQILPQVLAITANNFLALSIGMFRALTAVVITEVTGPSNNSSLHLTLKQASWYGGFTYIFHPVGSLISGTLLQSLGCKKLMIFSNLPVLACWVMSYRASSVIDLYFSGALIGIVCGLLGVVETRYTSETAHPSVRSILTTYSQLFPTVGFFAIYSLSTLINWRHVSLICGIVPIVCTLALLWIPESPIWLMSKGRLEESLQSLQWLRGWTSANSVREEFNKLKIYSKKKKNDDRLTSAREKVKELEYEREGQSLVVAPQSEKSRGGTTMTKENTGNARNISIDSEVKLENEKSLIEKLREILRFEMFVPLCKIILLFTTIALCGISSMQPFIIKNYDELKLPMAGKKLALQTFYLTMPLNVYSPTTSVKGKTCHIQQAFLSVISLCNNFLCMLIIKKIGKKRLFMISSTLTTVCVILLAVFARQLLKDQENDPSNDSSTKWILSALFVVHTCFFAVGVMNIPWILLGEILPFKGRGIATGIAVSYRYLFIFIGVKLYPILVESLNLDGTFLFFAIGSIPCVILVYFVIPETEGKFLADIEAEITQKIKEKA